MTIVEKIVWDREKGELRILGQRHLAIDAQALCDHLDSLVGPTVAEVIMDNHERRLGKEDAARFRREKPKATVREIIDTVIETDLLSGAGITKITLPQEAVHEGAIFVEIQNPCVKGVRGAAKALLLSYWCGALSGLFGNEFEAQDVIYKETDNILTARILTRVRK
jgi:hypothetical protein